MDKMDIDDDFVDELTDSFLNLKHYTHEEETALLKQGANSDYIYPQILETLKIARNRYIRYKNIIILDNRPDLKKLIKEFLNTNIYQSPEKAFQLMYLIDNLILKIIRC